MFILPNCNGLEEELSVLFLATAQMVSSGTNTRRQLC